MQKVKKLFDFFVLQTDVRIIFMHCDEYFPPSLRRRLHVINHAIFISQTRNWGFVDPLQNDNHFEILLSSPLKILSSNFCSSTSSSSSSSLSSPSQNVMDDNEDDENGCQGNGGEAERGSKAEMVAGGKAGGGGGADPNSKDERQYSDDQLESNAMDAADIARNRL